jgi:hypothetical protein
MVQGQVEKNVQDSRHLILHLMPDFADLADLNAWLGQRCLEQWEGTQHGTLPTLRDARHLIASWRDDDNHHCPYSSLDGLAPREYHQRSEVDQTPNGPNS